MVLIALVAVSVTSAYFLGMSITGQFAADEDYDEFAKCLTQKGAVMYGREGCSWCAKQKEMFGDSLQYVTYVECPEQPELCQEKGINAVPTWEINGELFTGSKSLEELSVRTDCPLG